MKDSARGTSNPTDHRRLPRRVAAVLALAAAAATASLAIGACSSSSDGATPAPQVDATAPEDAKPAPPDDNTPQPGTCPTTDPIDATQFPYAPPNVQPGACTDADLADFVAYVNANADSKYPDWKAHVTQRSAVCATCAFGSVTDPAWRPLVEDNGQLATYDVGGCIQLVSGGNEACGKAYQQWFDCRFRACDACPAQDQGRFLDCLTAASNGACRTATQAINTACGAEIGTYEAACQGQAFVFERPIQYQCIAPPPDGGVDAGPDASDAGDAGDAGDGG